MLPKHLNRASKIFKASGGKRIQYNTENKKYEKPKNTAESFYAETILTK